MSRDNRQPSSCRASDYCDQPHCFASRSALEECRSNVQPPGLLSHITRIPASHQHSHRHHLASLPMTFISHHRHDWRPNPHDCHLHRRRAYELVYSLEFYPGGIEIHRSRKSVHCPVSRLKGKRQCRYIYKP
jgi:hypothetical protein